MKISGDEASFEKNGWDERRRRLEEVKAERLKSLSSPESAC